MEFRKIKEIVEFNPTEHLKKGTVAKKISMEKLENFKKHIRSYDIEQYSGGTKFKNGDTLLARITPCLENGKTAKVTLLGKNEIGFGSTEYIVMRSIENVSDEDYIYYLAISPEFRNIAIKSMTGTSGRQRVQLDVVKNTKMKLSNYKEQVKIGKVLSVLDDKIKLNNQINDNLFEVIKENYNNLMSEISENSLIKLSEICEISSGKRPKLKGNKYTIPLIGASGIMDYTNISNYDNDIIIIGRVGTLGIVKRYFDGIWASDNTITLKAQFPNIVENYLNTIDYNSLNRGSTQPLITQNDIKDLTLKYDKDKYIKFEKDVVYLREKINQNNVQNETLSQLRDTLLPKLMNGEIDLDKIEI